MNPQKKILIVEDDELLSKMLVQKLTADGFAVIAATDGEEGLAKATAERPDLILLDLLLPVMDGITMLQKLRMNEGDKRTPVIVLTNLSDSVQVEKAVAEGVHDYLVKTDWMPEDLLKRVKERLGVR